MKLFEEVNIGLLRLKNRIVMAPMNTGGLSNSDGSLSQRAIDYYTERAKGGVGMIITGAARVTRKFERDKETIPLWMPFADHMIHVHWINDLAERCHDYGTKLAIQLTPGGGRISGPYLQEHGLSIGPSANKCFYPPYKNTRELTVEEIHIFIKEFEKSASIIKQAGADAIELHGHEGYLLDQFSCSLWNRRKDQYGGSLENRLRFAKELIGAIKKGAGDDFPVIFRYGLTHYLEGGRTEQEGIDMARLLESYGADALDIDAGSYEKWYLPHPPSTIKAGEFIHLAEKAKSVVSIPVISSGKISYPDVAEEAVMENKADLIALGRPLIADPEWVNKTELGQQDTILPCIGCHEGCLKRLSLYKSISCAVNPAAGNETYLKIERSENPKKILIIGGGVTGIVSSIVLTKRGHKVVLIEKQDELGGNFRLSMLPEFKQDYRKYIEYLIKQLVINSVEVRLGHKFETQKDIKEFQPDIIINASGARFKKHNISGLEPRYLSNISDCFSKKDFHGHHVIVGGGLVGAEAALNIAMNGGKCTVIEIKSNIAANAYRPNRDHLLALLEEQGVSLKTNSEVISVSDNTIICRNNLSKTSESINFEKIVYCAGMEPRVIEIDLSLKDNLKFITLGDANKPGMVIDAVWDAYRKMRLI
jgi:2-enoate reductase